MSKMKCEDNNYLKDELNFMAAIVMCISYVISEKHSKRGDRAVIHRLSIAL